MHSHCVSNQYENLSACRDAVLHNFGLIPEVPWDSFLQILPPSHLDSETAARVLDVLEASEIVDSEGWKSFASEPAKCSSRESEVFRPLDDLFDAIVAACKKELAMKPGPYKWTTIANTTPKSARKSTCKPDAWLVLASDTHAQHVGDEERYYWEDCCLSARFIKKTSNNNTNDVCTHATHLHRSCLRFRVHRNES